MLPCSFLAKEFVVRRIASAGYSRRRPVADYGRPMQVRLQRAAHRPSAKPSREFFGTFAALKPQQLVFGNETSEFPVARAPRRCFFDGKASSNRAFVDGRRVILGRVLDQIG